MNVHRRVVLPHESKARDLAHESPWPWWEIRYALDVLDGSTIATRSALAMAAGLGLSLQDAALRIRAAMGHIR